KAQRSPAPTRALFASGGNRFGRARTGVGCNAVLGSLGSLLPRPLNLLLKLCSRDSALTTAPCDQFPERRVGPKFQLFCIETFDTNNQSDWLALSSNYDPFALCFTDTSVKVRVF